MSAVDGAEETIKLQEQIEQRSGIQRNIVMCSWLTSLCSPLVVQLEECVEVSF